MVHIKLQICEHILEMGSKFLGSKFKDNKLKKTYFPTVMKLQIKGQHTARIEFSLQYFF